ncbi:GEVED domain-containing protein [Pseudomarimonas salicorniae]|uniref:GEVED domain-containing protein n=1 Tax=Pseudomarimonas salicorniae TaxID=2933270 RepID=A0ABT0GFW4_9GAMM|nr:GEVED domain-containing protein [Lysobacter sp. CAU 1642]MCK7593436.1 GEVED domain-containing protein [Lysobacter sp. CAU 1642]
MTYESKGALARAALLLLSLCATGLAQAQDPNVTLGKQLVSPAANATVPPGSDVRYRITYACNGVSQPNCGSLTLNDSLPAELEIVSCDFPAFSTVSCPVGGNAFSATRNLINSGVTGEGFINARVRPSAPPTNGVINTVTATFTNNVGNQPLPVTASSPPINIRAAALRNYSISKVRVDPIASLLISDQATFVTDRVQFCATSGVDLVALPGATLYDDLPAIASNPRTTVPAGSPAITESISGNRITWTIPQERLEIDRLYPAGSSLSQPSCFTFFVTYDLPAGVAPAQDRAHVRTPDDQYCSEAGLGVPPPGDTDNPQCFGETNGTRGGPQSIVSLSKTGNDATPSDTPDDQGIGRINWRLGGSYESNVGLQDVQVFDILPDDVLPGSPTRLQVASFTLGNWVGGAPLYDVVADVFVTDSVPAPTSDCGNPADWVQVAFDAPGNNSTTISGGSIPVDSTGICWRFENLAGGTPANEVPRDFAFTSSPTITQPVPSTITPPALPAATTVENCLQFNWNAGGAQTSNTCRTQRIEEPRPGLDPVKTVFSAPSPLRPLDEIVYRIGVNHAVGDSTGAIVDPVITDLLPPQLELIGTPTVVQPGSPVPVIEVIEDFNAVTDQTLVRIRYTGSFPRNAAQMPLIELRTRIRAGTADGSYSNRVAVFENGSAPATCAGTQAADTDDLDNDTDTAELRCQRDLGFNIVQAAVLDGTKWVSGPGPFENPADEIVDDPIELPVTANADCPVYSTEFGTAVDANPYTRFPCVARTDFGGAFTYRIRVQNAGNVAFDNYVIYDVFPFIGDTGVGEPQSTVTRNTRFRPVLTGAPVLNGAQTTAPIAGNFVVEYSASTNPCRREVSDDDDQTGWQGSCTNDWNSDPTALGGFPAVRAIRIYAFTDPNGSDTTNWGVLQTAVFEIPMQAPAYQQQPVSGDALPSVVGSTTVFNPAYGSFAHRAYRAVTGAALDPINLLPTAEPVKVGVILPERYRVGNLVWRDINNDGDHDQGEPGIDGVALRLCLDDDGTAGPSAGDTTVDTTGTVTLGGRAGKYRFDELARDTRYYIAIPDLQAPLAGLQVSTNNARDPNNRVDNDNNASPGAVTVCGGGTGYVSAPNWAVGDPSANEPTNERTHSNSGNADDDPNNGAGTDTWPDRMSNFSADFGFSNGGGAAIEDLGDLPDTGNGDTTGNYRTLLSDNGPSHIIVPNLYLGASVDAELDGQPNSSANGDDTSGVPDDEDGVTTPSQLEFFRGEPAVVELRVVNDTGSDARLCAYADWNADGDFNDTVSGVLERAPAVIVPSGTGAGGSLVNVDWGSVPYPGPFIEPTYVRFRLSLDSGTCSAAFANGPSASGEVEDYAAVIVAIDRGDLPDAGAGVATGDYETLTANGGPAHVILSSVRFGSQNDHDQDGRPSIAANGDDTAPGGQPDDEDGFTVSDLTMVAGSVANVRFNVTNTSGSTAIVCGFIDFNGNGVLDDIGETASLSVNTGTNNAQRTLSFSVPLLASRNTYARFRIDVDGGGAASCSPNGVRFSGEVEDYAVTINAYELGDLPDVYGTLVASGGARHLIAPGFPAAPNLFLGAGVDNEIDGAPSVLADGDDAAVGDDEDGIDVADLSLQVNVPPVIDVTARNETGTAARICGFIDYNADGDFDDAGESAEVAVPAVAGSQSLQLTFAPPLVGAASSTYARFRISTDTAGTCVPTGDAPNGEVEDYAVSIVELSDLGDLPDSYGTLRASNGARHPLRPNLRLGTLIDDEADGQPGSGADGDDLASSDDEDAVLIADLGDSNLVAGLSANIRVRVTNGTGVPARLCGYVDFNADGDFADTGEVSQVPVPDGSNDVEFILPFNVPDAARRDSFARFRLSTLAGTCTAATARGVEPDGEVEDYPVRVRVFDLGDLPDPSVGIGPDNYRTTRADGGPRHVIVDQLFLGARVDEEPDGQPNVNATGDDVANDDEDGVTFMAAYELGSPARVDVVASNTTGSTAQLCGFIDWNADGDFLDESESAQSSVPDGSVGALLTMNFGLVPVGADLTPYARFRISTDPTCSPDGEASDGEVEDYLIGTTGNGALELGNLVWEDRNNNCRVDIGEPGLSGIPVDLFLDSDRNGQPDGPAVGSTVTDLNGNYLFVDLLPDDYLVVVQRPERYIGSTGSGLPFSNTGACATGVDPDNDVDDDDNGFDDGAVTRAPPVTLIAESEPGPPNSDTNPTVDFGLLYFFDLDLVKELAPGQRAEVLPGATVEYRIRISNQGTVPATDIEVTDRYPAGFQVLDSDWTVDATNRLARRVIPGPLLPGQSVELAISMRVLGGAAGRFLNRAEITRAEDDLGGTPTDIDSTPDNDNEGEDDQDEVPVLVLIGVPTQIPVGSPWGLGLLVLLTGLLALRHIRRRS